MLFPYMWGWFGLPIVTSEEPKVQNAKLNILCYVGIKLVTKNFLSTHFKISILDVLLFSVKLMLFDYKFFISNPVAKGQGLVLAKNLSSSLSNLKPGTH